MSRILDVEVIGTPVPQGSLRAFNRRGGGRPIVTSDNVRTRPWKDAVAWNAREHLVHQGAGPVRLRIIFRFGRPASHFGKRGLLPSAPIYPAGRPDLDKLIRSVADALTEAGVWRDDSQVVDVQAWKQYCTDPGDVPGARIAVDEATE